MLKLYHKIESDNTSIIYNLAVPLRGIEPLSRPPEGRALSVKPQGLYLKKKI